MLPGSAEHDRVGGDGVAAQPFRDVLCVQVDVVFAPGVGIDGGAVLGDVAEALCGVEHHRDGGDPAGGHDCDRAARPGGGQVLRVGGAEQVEPQVDVGGCASGTIGVCRRLPEDAYVGHDRPTLLGEAGLVEAAHVLSVEECRHAEDLSHGYESGAADPDQTDRDVCADACHWGGQVVGRWGRGRAPLGIGPHRHERRAVAFDAGAVFVA